MASKELIEAVQGYDEWYEKHGVIEDTFLDYYYDACNVAYVGENDVEFARKISEKLKRFLDIRIKMEDFEDFYSIDYVCNQHKVETPLVNRYYDVLKLEAPYIFSSYMLYLEKKRDNERRFFANRMRQFNKFNIISSMQALEDDELDILSVSLPPGTGKTTVEKFFASWIVGRHPQDYSLFFTHSDELEDLFYRGILDITTNDEYLYGDIFPDCRVVSTDAKAKKINYYAYKAFANIQCTSVGTKNAGKVRANRYLYCDDMVSSIEEALNKAQLDKLWRIYASDARQRKLNQRVKEMHIATRWSVYDPIGRLKEAYADDPRARFIAVPDIDPVTGESNFDYRHDGMSVEFFNDIALTMDDVTYRCLYKNEPIEREGLLIHEDELRRYKELPDGEPDAIIGICDTKTTGSDYMFLPCAYQYGDDYYVDDCVCDNAVYNELYPKMTDVILENNMQLVEFESNAGGTQIADEIEKRVKEAGGRCVITRKPTETNKETRILASAPWIIRHMVFKEKELYAPKSDYGMMIHFILTYSVTGKNKNDDVLDGLSNFYNLVTRRKPRKKAKIVRNPFGI